MKSSKEMLAEIEALKHTQQELAQRVSGMVKEYKDTQLQELGVPVGSFVLYKGTEHCVVGQWGTGTWPAKPWLTGNPRKKDGTVGVREVCMYADWEKI